MAAVAELDGGQIASHLDEHFVVLNFYHTKILGIISPNPNLSVFKACGGEDIIKLLFCNTYNSKYLLAISHKPKIEVVHHGGSSSKF